MGNGIPEAISALTEAGAFAIGSNCGNGITNMIKVGTQLRKTLDNGIILLKPNAGEPVIKDGVTCYTETAADFENHFRELSAFKPLILGGCCGTGPSHISAFRKLIDVNR
jgi:methionine synthase I (cobalamin-dependent)